MTGKDLDAVYRDRNVLAIHFVKKRVFEPSPKHGGWMPAPDTGDQEEDWAIVWYNTLCGEVSWHVPRDLAEKHLPRNEDRDYSGYSREVKNDRLWNLVDDLKDLPDHTEGDEQE